MSRVVSITSENVSLVVEKSAHASASLGNISQSVDKISEMSRLIASASEEQSQATGQIDQNVTAIFDMSNQAMDGSTQIASSSSDLKNLGVELMRLVEKFKV